MYRTVSRGTHGPASIINTLNNFTPISLECGSDKDINGKEMFCFQCLDIVCCDSLSPSAYERCQEWDSDIAGCESSDDDDVIENFKKDCPKTQVCLFGCNQEGKSVVVIVTDFRPFIFVEVPAWWSSDKLDYLVKDLSGHARYQRVSRSDVVTWENSHLMHQLYGFVPSDDDPNEPKVIKIIKLSFESESLMRCCCRTLDVMSKQGEITIHEQNVQMVSKFLDATRLHASSTYTAHTKEEGGIQPCSWVGVQNTSVLSRVASCKYSRCDIELECKMCDLVGLPDVKIVAPYVVASVDIECFSETNEFPEDQKEKDVIFCIGTTIQRFGFPQTRINIAQYIGNPLQGDSKHHTKIERNNPQCDSNNKSPDDLKLTAIGYQTERLLLEGWRDLIVSVDADIITGYNLNGFDYKYMYNRARMASSKRFFRMSKLAKRSFQMDIRQLSSNALGDNVMHIFPLEGRVTLDMYLWIKSRFKLDRYGLSYVGEHFLGETKVDLPYKTMNQYYRDKNPEELWQVLNYCVQDCNIPLNLMETLQGLIELSELSRITMTLFNQIVSRGQQIRVYNQIMLMSHLMGYVVNSPPIELSVDGNNDKFIGATVIEPSPGFYQMPIATLDFNSLYPSIIQAHNLCYSTWVAPKIEADLKCRLRASNTESDITKLIKEYDTTSNIHCFMQTRKGVLPSILSHLLTARNAVKKQMKDAKTPSEKALLDGRQLALKVSANSVYGFTGARSKGIYPLVAIAETTTCVGRTMIYETKAIMESDGYRVIYGDTDSVMVDFGIDKNDPIALEKAFQLGTQAAKRITDHFPELVVIEMEKAYYPYLLIAKKRYAGLMYTVPHKWDKIDAKGIEIVRRDTSSFTRKLLKDVLDRIMFDRDIEAANHALQLHLTRVVNNEIPFEDYIMTKSLRNISQYKNKDGLAHVRVVEKMLARKDEAPRVGDRVSFVLVETKDRNSKTCEKAEDPVHVLKHGLRVDREHYIRHQVINPICTLFKAFNDDPQRLFDDVLARLTRQRFGIQSISTFFTAPCKSSVCMDESNSDKSGDTFWSGMKSNSVIPTHVGNVMVTSRSGSRRLYEPCSKRKRNDASASQSKYKRGVHAPRGKSEIVTNSGQIQL